jgi:hypothetical protein
MLRDVVIFTVCLVPLVNIILFPATSSLATHVASTCTFEFQIRGASLGF